MVPPMTVFDKSTIDDVNKKVQKTGIDGVDDKTLLIYIASYFNTEMKSMKKVVVMAVISLWGIFGSIVVGLLTNHIGK